MLKNNMYIDGISQVFLKLLGFKVGSGNYQSFISKISVTYMGLVSLKMASHLTSHNFRILKIETFSKPCKI